MAWIHTVDREVLASLTAAPCRPRCCHQYQHRPRCPILVCAASAADIGIVSGRQQFRKRLGESLMQRFLPPPNVEWRAAATDDLGANVLAVIDTFHVPPSDNTATLDPTRQPIGSLRRQ